eukprot:1311173-Rhodomonas_salina.2
MTILHQDGGHAIFPSKCKLGPLRMRVWPPGQQSVRAHSLSGPTAITDHFLAAVMDNEMEKEW